MSEETGINQAKHVEEETASKGGFAHDLFVGLKENWWKILTGVAAAGLTFAAGYAAGSQNIGDQQVDEGADEAPFEEDGTSEL